MLKSGLKNYFINLKYYFTPIGTFAVGIIIGLSILLPGALAAVSQFAEEVTVIIKGNNVDFTPTKDFIVNSITSLDWSDPIAALGTMLSKEWINSVAEGSLKLISTELEHYSVPITQSFNAMIANMVFLFVVFVVFCVAGLVVGYVLTRFLVRRNMARRVFWKFFLSAVVDSLLAAGLVAFCVWLFTVWKPSVIISSLFSFIVFGSVTLLQAYLIHGLGKIKLRQVLNLKNIVFLNLSNLIVFYISVVLLSAAIALTNAFAGIFIGFAFVEIALIVINFNAEGYVKSLAQVSSPEELPFAA